MDKNALKLINFCSENIASAQEWPNSFVNISPNLKHFSVLENNDSGDVNIYSITTRKKKDPNDLLIWRSPDPVASCIFSDSGDQFLVVLKTNSILLYDVKTNVTEVSINVEELASMLRKFGFVISAASSLLPLNFSQHQILLLIDNQWLVSLKWLNFSQLYVAFAHESPANIIAWACSTSSIFLLTSQGNVSEHYKDSGRLVGAVNIEQAGVSCLPCRMAASTDGTLLALSDAANSVCILALDQFITQSQGSIVDLDTGSVQSSTQTTTSITSQLLDASKAARGKRSLFRATWERYMNILQTPRQSASKQRPALLRVNGPAGFSVNALSITSSGLGICYVKSDGSRLYRLYDLMSSDCLGEVNFKPSDIFVPGGFINQMDAVVSPDSISALLGTLASDALVKKLAKCLESRSLCEILQTDEWGNILVPLTVFNSSLRRGQLDLVKLAFSFSLQALKAALLSSSEDEVAMWQHRIDKTVLHMEQLFESVHYSTQESVEHQQVVSAALDHTNDVLQVLNQCQHEVDAVKRRIMSHLSRLKSWLEKQSVEQAVEAWSGMDKEEASKWRAMEDRHFIRLAISQNNLIMAHTYLSNSRHFDEDQVKSFIQAEFDIWFEQLLLSRDLETCERILANMGRIAREELKTICFQSTDRSLRDALVSYLNPSPAMENQQCLEEAEVDAWKFVSMIEDSVPSSKLSIFSILNKTAQSRTVMMLDLYFNDLLTVDVEFESSDVWRYLIETNRIELLINWIKGFYEGNSTDPKFAVLQITQQMIDNVASFESMNVTKQAVLDQLSKHEMFCSTESDASSIIRRMVRTKSLHTDVSLHFKIAEYIIAHSLPALAFPCLANHKFTSEEISQLCSDTKKTYWFRVWLAFRDLANEPSRSNLHKAIKISSIHLAGDASLEEYLEEHPFIALADVICSNGSIAHDLGDNIKKKIPLLALGLAEGDITPKADVSVYDLLRKAALFDVNKLYNSHEQEFPHFSSVKLASRYGRKDVLGWLYYLKQARPCYAVNTFLVEEFRAHGGISRRNMRQACNMAHGLALQKIENLSIVAACVSFISMLGCSAELLRIHVSAAKYIMKSSNFANGQKIDLLLQGLVNNEMDARKKFLALLESALEEFADEDLARFNVAVKFSRAHDLDLPERFLKRCASKNRWLPFMTFITIHEYPLPQVIKLVHCFKSSTLCEHLSHAIGTAVLRNSQAEASPGVDKVAPRALGSRDTRRGLYSRIGLKSKESSPQEEASPETEPKSVGEDQSTVMQPSTYSVLESIAKFTGVEDDLFRVLLDAHRSSDPPQSLLSASVSLGNPVLAVLATCYEPGSVLAACCCYLRAGLDTTRPVPLSWSLTLVQELMAETLAASRPSSLAKALKIFLPDNPLCHFSDFLVQCIVCKQFDESILNMKQFQASCLNLRSNPATLASDDSEGSFLLNGHWISCVALQLAEVAMTQCFHSAYHQLLFIRCLCAVSFGDHLTVTTPNFCRLAQIVESLSGTTVHADLGKLCNSDYHESELQRCLTQLVNKRKFDVALSFASLSGLSIEPVVVARWSHQLQITQDMKNFCEECEADLRLQDISASTAAGFYFARSSEIESQRWKYSLLRLALSWLEKADESDLNVAEVECAMWTSWLEADIADNPLLEQTAKLFRSVRAELLMEYPSHLTATLSKQQASKLDTAINQLLDGGHVLTACKLQAMFSHKNQDLEVLLTCLSLAEEELSPYDLSTDMRKLVQSRPRNTAYRRRTLPPSSTSSSKLSELNVSLVEVVDTQYKQRQDSLQLLESLTERLAHGTGIARRVLHCFRAAAHLDKLYIEIIRHEDPMQLVYECIYDQFSVVSDLVVASQMSTQQMAATVGDEIIRGEGRSAWGCDLDANFHVVVELCGDASLLGNKLLKASRKLPQDKVDQAVELLIRAHACFTSACNMEGIACVLHYASSTTYNILLPQKHWSFMVRLVTGIGRYTEMSYIFQILKDQEQFEFLLGRGMDKVDGLKSALLEFLKQNCPEDKDLFRMVALHFSLYAEVASLWQLEALSELQGLDLVNTEATKKQLNTAMKSYTHAAQYYIQANKLTRACNCAHQAELVALQTSLITKLPAGANRTAPSVLQLKSEQVTHLITNTLSFPQAWIVSQAYGHPTDWAAALYQHSIKLSEESYLSELADTMTLTPALVDDVVKRFQRDPNPTEKMTQQVKQLILTLNSVEVTYRVASQLGFRDVIDDLLSGSELAYLKDTVWRSGYSRQNY